MWLSVAILALFIVGLPALWYWLWRGKFLPHSHPGPRLELHREQVAQSVRSMIPVWLLMVLAEINTFIHMNPVSHDFRLIWYGFFSASQLFIIAFAGINFMGMVRQGREKSAENGADEHPLKPMS